MQSEIGKSENRRILRRGFTLVEMMMVVGILSVLLTIVVASVKDSIKATREHRAEALCSAVQTGLATYYAQNDEWPQPLRGMVESGSVEGRSNREGANGENDPNVCVLSASEVRQLVKELVNQAKGGNPLMDISALFVSRDPGEAGGTGIGMDFFTAVRGDKRSKKRMNSSEMYFGYPDANTGKFRRFKMVYSIPADQLRVMVQ